MKIETKLEIYEVEGKETVMIHRPVLSVQSHWNDNKLIEVTVDGKRVTVVAKDLKRAVDNATNHGF